MATSGRWPLPQPRLPSGVFPHCHSWHHGSRDLKPVPGSADSLTGSQISLWTKCSWWPPKEKGCKLLFPQSVYLCLTAACPCIWAPRVYRGSFYFLRSLKSNTLHSSFTSYICVLSGTAERSQRRLLGHTGVRCGQGWGRKERCHVCMVYPQLSSGPQVFIFVRRFHSFYVCLPGAIHKKAAQITEVRFKKQLLPWNVHPENNEEKIPKGGFYY